MKKVLMLLLVYSWLCGGEYTIQIVAASHDESVKVVEKRAIEQGMTPVLLRGIKYKKLVVGSYESMALANQALAHMKRIMPDAFVRPWKEVNSQMRGNKVRRGSNSSAAMVYISTDDSCVFRYNCQATGEGVVLPKATQCKKIIVDYNCPKE